MMFARDRFKPNAPDVQAVVRLEDALPPGHPIHVLVDLVHGVNLSHVVIPPGPKGEKAYHPRALFGILAWGYLHGVRSARKLARLARQEAPFVYPAGGGAPNYRTPARCRRDTATAFAAVSRETVVLARRPGPARPGRVALEGTTLKAATSKHKAMSYGRMRHREARLKEEIARPVERGEARDTAEDQEYGADPDGSSVAEELARREARLATIQAARERPEAEERAEQGRPEGAAPEIAAKERRSFADDDARIRPMKRGAYDYAYNARAAVDAESGAIVAATLTTVAPDTGHLPQLVAEVRALRAGAGPLADHPTTVSADAGYFSGEHAAEDGDGLDLLIAAGRDDPAAATTKATVYAVDRFGDGPARDVWICPADKPVHPAPSTGQRGRPGTNRYRAASADCADCPLRATCLKPGEGHRLLHAQDRRLTGAMRLKLRQPDARRRYARRKAIVEPAFGHLKEARGFASLSLRGPARAAGEYFPACLAHNLGKLLRVCPLPGTGPAPATV